MAGTLALPECGECSLRSNTPFCECGGHDGPAVELLSFPLLILPVNGSNIFLMGPHLSLLFAPTPAPSLVAWDTVDLLGVSVVLEVLQQCLLLRLIFLSPESN